MISNPVLYMLIGVPGSGKSTWINNAKFQPGFDTTIISTDNFIEAIASLKNTTYDAIFKEYIKAAEKRLYEDLIWAVDHNTNIVWDQTNITSKTRKKKLSMIPSHYKKIGIFFPTPSDEELSKRLSSRPGKNIPDYVMDAMIESIEQPTLLEGFDEVRVVA